MRLLLIVSGLAACSGTSGTYHPPTAGDQGDHNAAELADPDEYKPAYTKADLEKALIAERGKELEDEKVVAAFEAGGQDVSGSDQMRTAVANLEVRRRYITSLEQCQSAGHHCPPRLDEPAFNYDFDGTGATPPLDAPLRFDLESWRTIATELHGRACACRTVVCLDAVAVAIDQLEPHPMVEVQGDEASSQSITWARECLFRLRGKH